MNKKFVALIVIFIMAATLISGCASKPQASQEPAGAPVILTVAGGWSDCKALESVGREFTEKYPNCTVVYEYLQDYDTSIEKRMTGENSVDLFFTTNIQEDSAMLPYALDLNSSEELDLSDTFDGLIENFTFRSKDAQADRLYAIPLGAEMRGLYINKTLLDSLNIPIPADQDSLLAACKVLQDNGYIPFHGNPGDFAQTLLYPWICNIIANADDPKAAYDKVNAREPGISEMFREPYEFLYLLIEKGYYDYKKAQTELNLFTETQSEDYARYFFNIQLDGETWKKTDDIGQVAFMPSPMSLQGIIDKTKEDYHSAIEYVFVPSPISKDGGFAYLSPGHGIAINKNSSDLEWSVKFLDFLFKPENNKRFAEDFNIIPNTKEAFDYIDVLYDIPNSQISHLGQVTFDYGFYAIISSSLLEVSKGNNPKYMQTNADGTTSLYPLDFYMNNLEEKITENDD